MKKKILALGADIKNRILFGQGACFCFGPDIGDLSQAENFELFKREVLKAVKKIRPEIIACDLHPGYFSTRLAQELSFQFPALDLQQIQHHHAHIASVIQEHNLKRPVIGVSFDGTGYGQDRHFWGGEFLLVERSGFKRLAYLKYRKMPGGERVVFEPWRMALSILGKRARPHLKGIKIQDQELILTMMAKNINSPLSSSAGRLFDASACLLGLCLFASYEAEGPIKLQALCEQNIKQSYDFQALKGNGCSIIDTDGLFLGMLKDLRQGKDKSIIATKFHNSIARIIIATSKKLAKSLGIKDIVLSGGVFQNNFLKNLVIKELTNSGLNLFTNIRIPVNDLNISLGQYYVSSCTGKG